MAYVPVPKDFSKIKTKLALNLTKRQIICFSLAGICGVPVYLLTKAGMGTDVAATLMPNSARSSKTILQCMKRMDFQQRKYCFTLSGRNF